MIDLDANFLVAVAHRDARAQRPLSAWIAAGETICMSSIAWSEFLCGPATVQQVEVAHAFLARIEPFTESDATTAAHLFNATGRRSRSHADCMIAAIAIRRNAAVATMDRTGFAPFQRHHLRVQTV